MTTSTVVPREHGGGLLSKAGPALLALGIGWMIFALAIPQLELRTPKSIAVLLGLLLLASAGSELATATTASREWRPVRAMLAVVFIAAGIIALVWPSPTFRVIARILAWYLLAKGIADLATALVRRRGGRAGPGFATESGGLPGRAPWWAPLVIGAFSIGVAFWAVGYPSQSRNLLVLWLALAALATGLSRFMDAFHTVGEVRPELRGEAGRAGPRRDTSGVDAVPPSGFGTRAATEAHRPDVDAKADTRPGSRRPNR
ncbi:DUF308 domain-containing protein [Frankia sp. CNm7]|uniref:DUF308 domain-containing protein n=1 Tax=Frankia nepalensis TaxID=1836974 RepID=A0A937RGK6_9ACTN|nr:DUF308 domain-containing protein [Frankia nepalensis]MBL7495739.1 DUF308 domain-containing protein [Frankia nepalensis]MBL7509013.1 DUF308 domain-containing protein [Frankia nepalensis]MBL7523476.1 DUF308 domain-containing protein [Frankia nepalensis]MBL7629812.1 DUF308 domain-containing protein [Frankia nepalensis]